MRGSITIRGKIIGIISLILIIYLLIFKKGDLKNENENEIEIEIENEFNYNMKKEPPNGTLRGKLAKYFPYDSISPIPRNIFQTWKTNRNDLKFPKKYISSVDSWDNLNKIDGYRHFIFSDDIIDEWVYNEFGLIKEIIKAWDLLPKNILKADFFRYLILFSRGGIYSDIDTFCLKKIEDWPIDNKSGLIIGIEADPDREDWYEWYARRIQFVQWTIVSKKGHPFLRELISRIVEETLRRERMGTLKIVEGKDEGGDIMSWTGPGIFTDTIFDYLNNILSDGKYGDGFGIGSKYWINGEKFKLKMQEIDKNGLPLHTNDMKINYTKFTRLRENIKIDDILILPITCFSPGVGQMGSKPPTDKLALVLHNFSGSWKPEKEKM